MSHPLLTALRQPIVLGPLVGGGVGAYSAAIDPKADHKDALFRILAGAAVGLGAGVAGGMAGHVAGNVIEPHIRGTSLDSPANHLGKEIGGAVGGALGAGAASQAVLGNLEAETSGPVRQKRKTRKAKKRTEE